MSYEIVVRFPDEMREPLQEAAKVNDRSINSLVRVAVAAWLDARQAPIPAPGQSASSSDVVHLSPMPSLQHGLQAAGAG